MKTISLTKGLVAKVSDVDYAYLRQFKWHTTQCGNQQYAKGRVGGRRQVYMHRVIAQRKGLPLDRDIDHKDGDNLNNTRSNLRVATRSQNIRNCHRPVRAKSGVRGVTSNGSGWMAVVTIEGKTIYLGTHRTIKEAAKAREAGVKKYYGDFAP